MTTNKKVLQFVDEAVALAKPDKVVWIDGSEAQLEALRKEAIASGEMIKLNDEKLPGCLYHRTKPNDVARVEGRTFTMQHPALGLAEPQQVLVGQLLQPAQVPRDGFPSLQRINCTAQLGVIRKLAEGALDAIVCH